MRYSQFPSVPARLSLTLLPLVAVCGCSPEPAPEVVAESEEPEETTPERIHREAQARGPLVANVTVANVQAAFSGLTAQNEAPAILSAQTPADVLGSYQNQAAYRGSNPRSQLVGDLTSLERRSAHVERQLARLTRERTRVKAASERAQVLDGEIKRFESELSSRQAQAKLLREALTQAN